LNFHESFVKAKNGFGKKPVPAVILRAHYCQNSVSTILEKLREKDVATSKVVEREKEELKLVFFQCRGQVSEKFEQSLCNVNAPSRH